MPTTQPQPAGEATAGPVVSSRASSTQEMRQGLAGKSLWTARVSSRSAVRSGAPLELAAGICRLHVFDPASGESIGHPLAAGVKSPA